MDDEQGYVIDPYTFQQWEYVTNARDKPAISLTGFFWRGSRKQAEAVMEIDN